MNDLGVLLASLAARRMNERLYGPPHREPLPLAERRRERVGHTRTVGLGPLRLRLAASSRTHA